MGLFDKILKRNSSTAQENVVSINSQPSSSNIQPNFINIQRNDGSLLQIAPAIDSMGQQLYEQIYNTITNQTQLIPKFWVVSDELKAYKSSLIHETLLLDIDPNILQVPYYAEQVANVLLNSTRMHKIIGQYHNYAGGFRYNPDGTIYDKFVDEGILNSLSLNAQERESARQASVIADRNQKISDAKKVKHTEDYPEQRLSQDMLYGGR